MPLPNKINKDNFGKYYKELEYNNKTGKKRSIKQRLAILLSKRGNR